MKDENSMGLDLNRFRDLFFQEAGEHLETMESALLGMQNGEGGDEALGAIFRSAHSMKAGAGTFGFDQITGFTHEMESLLDRMRNHEVEASAALVDLLLRAVDMLGGMIEAARTGGAGPEGAEALRAELERVRQAGEPPPSPLPGQAPPPCPAMPEARFRIRFEPHPDLFRVGLDPLLALRDLAQLGTIEAVEADCSRLPEIDALEPETCYLGWRLRIATSAGAAELRDVFAFYEDMATVVIEAEPAQTATREPVPVPRAVTPAPAALREASIRVATDKVDRLIDLVGELVIAQSMAAQIMNGFTVDRLGRLQEAMAEMDRYTRELQDRAMRIRMLPIGTVFSRFRRLVHDTAQALGKQVTLEIAGEETELDKGMVERIADPLTHLVRNAVDHGIEPPAERVAAGKPAEGRLRLTAYHEGGNVIVEVCDDGRGLDAARIRAKAVERGLLDAGEEIAEEDLLALIFRPGFSTAQKVSDLSGRGVGMDVVKKSVEALSGAVAMETRPGAGTTFRIKLPLTLAILDGLLVRVGGQTFVLPLVAIAESIQPRRGQVLDPAGRGEVIEVRRDPLPLLRLHRVFGISTEITDPSQGLVVIVENEGRRLALLVDELLGQQQVVVKSLETNYRRVDGVTGATILGDGRAALILDVAGIAAMARASRAAA